VEWDSREGDGRKAKNDQGKFLALEKSSQNI
jgi:hypothetical protein